MWGLVIIMFLGSLFTSWPIYEIILSLLLRKYGICTTAKLSRQTVKYNNNTKSVTNFYQFTNTDGVIYEVQGNSHRFTDQIGSSTKIFYFKTSPQSKYHLANDFVNPLGAIIFVNKYS